MRVGLAESAAAKRAKSFQHFARGLDREHRGSIDDRVLRVNFAKARLEFSDSFPEVLLVKRLGGK